MAEQPAALADERDAALDAAQRLAREQHVQHHAVDVVGDAEAVGADHGKPGLSRGDRNRILRRAVADLGEARRKHHGRTDFAPRTGLDRFAHAGGRQREHGKIDTLRQFVRAFQHGPAVDRVRAPADQVNVARKLVELQSL